VEGGEEGWRMKMGRERKDTGVGGMGRADKQGTCGGGMPRPPIVGEREVGVKLPPLEKKCEKKESKKGKSCAKGR